MLFRAFIVLSVIVSGLCVAKKYDLPVPTCKRNSSDYNSCLKHAIKEAWPLFIAGLPAEFEFPSLDPLLYGDEKAIYNNNILHGEVLYSNMIIEGFRATHFMAVRTHFGDDTFRMEIDIRIPKIVTYGNCEAHGTIGGFRMGGKGSFHLTLEDVRGTWDISGPVKNDTWIIEHLRIAPMVRSLKINLDNFFEGSRELNNLANMFVNDNWPLLYRLVLPTISDIFDIHFSKMATPLFSKLSFSKVFP